MEEEDPEEDPEEDLEEDPSEGEPMEKEDPEGDPGKILRWVRDSLWEMKTLWRIRKKKEVTSLYRTNKPED